jgi:hypothetical protein
MTSVKVNINLVMFIRNKCPVISTEGFYALEKNMMICLQRAVLPVQSKIF